MPVIVVANPKGGVGKSTLSTNVAGLLAREGTEVLLGDIDPQHSSRTWLSLRPPELPVITPWEVVPDVTVRPPKGASVVLDTPAGLHGYQLDEVMKIADKVLVPLQPSIFDIHATHAFLQALMARRHSHKLQIGVVGMRLREGTISADQLRNFLGTIDLPVIAYLRDTQNYVHLAAHGLTLWDVAPSRVERDLEQWQPLIDWIHQ